MRLDAGLVVELWNKGMLWDKLIGTHWLPLIGVKHSNQVSSQNQPIKSQLFSANKSLGTQELSNQKRASLSQSCPPSVLSKSVLPVSQNDICPVLPICHSDLSFSQQIRRVRVPEHSPMTSTLLSAVISLDLICRFPGGRRQVAVIGQ